MICARCGHEYYDTSMRKCNHPAVQAKFGKNAYICIYCCRRKPCPNAVKAPLVGMRCALEADRDTV